MTKTNTNRIVAMILSLVMCLSLAVPAFAASTENRKPIYQMTYKQLKALPVDPAYKEIFDAMVALQEVYPNGTPWGRDKFLHDENGNLMLDGRDYLTGDTSFARIVTNAAFGADAPVRRITRGDFTYDDIRIGDEIRINDHPEMGLAGYRTVVVLNILEDGLVTAESDRVMIGWFNYVERQYVEDAQYLTKRYYEQPAQPVQPAEPETPVTPVTPTVSFTDVKPTDWYYDAVNWAVSNGITNGTTTTTFSPNNNCKNVEIITFLHRAAGSPAVKNVSLPFAVQNGWATDALTWAYGNGIIGSNFNENAACTRYTAVDYIWKAFGNPTIQSSVNFNDISGYDKVPIAWAVGKGIVNGTSATTFSPNNTCTRGTIATLLYRAYAG